MAQLDYSIGTARTPLNIQPGIQNYYMGQQNKRQNQQAKLIADADMKQKTIADFVSQSMTPEGELDRKALSSRLLNKGWLGDDAAIKSDLMKQDQSIADMQIKREEYEGKRMGALADFYLNSDDKDGAYQTILETMQNERIEMPPNWGLMPDPGVDQQMEMISTRFGAKGKGGDSKFAPEIVTGPDGKLYQASRQPGQLGLKPYTLEDGSHATKFQKPQVLKGESGYLTFDPNSQAITETGVKPDTDYKKGIDFAKLDIDKDKLELDKDKAEREKAQAAEKHQTLKLSRASEVASLNEFADLAAKLANSDALPGVTGLGAMGRVIPGTKYADLNADLERFISMGAIETMAKLKRESPTGSTGFGALSEKELKVIQDAFAALENRKQSPEKLKQELKRVEKGMRDYLNRIAEFEAKNPAPVAPAKVGRFQIEVEE